MSLGGVTAVFFQPTATASADENQTNQLETNENVRTEGARKGEKVGGNGRAGS